MSRTATTSPLFRPTKKPLLHSHPSPARSTSGLHDIIYGIKFYPSSPHTFLWSSPHNQSPHILPKWSSNGASTAWLWSRHLCCRHSSLTAAPWAPRQPSTINHHPSSCQWNHYEPYWIAPCHALHWGTCAHWWFPLSIHISGTLLSWNVSKGLTLLPEHYPNHYTIIPHLNQQLHFHQWHQMWVPICLWWTHQNNGWRKLHCTDRGCSTILRSHTSSNPVCLLWQATCKSKLRGKYTAYSEHVKAELNLLQQQGVSAPVTQPTDWCAPIVVTPKKGTNKNKNVSTFPAWIGS